MDSEPSIFSPAPLRLEGHGLVLREWDDGDIPALAGLYEDPEIDRWTPVPSPFDESAALAYLAGARKGRAEERAVHLAVTTDGYTPLGEVLFFPGDPGDPGGSGDPGDSRAPGASGGRDVELAYGIGSRYRRRGLASRAVQLVGEHLYRHRATGRVLLRIEADNVASAAVARSAGFRLTGEQPLVRAAKGREVVLHTWCHQRVPGAAPS
ncbi:GNAT family N-acetyltransferase [Streptomyces sp. NPDC049954]|uniref:GNAT family N-acetyltransferase n=1 Tax=Streptomyces sp. NPDC049954 TaxID=3155779 RepID=UPI00342A3BF8